jgi:hypothetical protein
MQLPRRRGRCPISHCHPLRAAKLIFALPPGRTVIYCYPWTGDLGAAVFGLSTQTTSDQRDVADRLHLPFELLSDTRSGLPDHWSCRPLRQEA